MKIKSDKFKKSRGGYSRLLNIACAECGEHLFNYQKDGPGIIKRTYLDRISNSKKYQNLQHLPLKKIPQLVCPNCKEHLGVPIIYKREQRPAFRIFMGAITKKIIKGKSLKSR